MLCCVIVVLCYVTVVLCCVAVVLCYCCVSNSIRVSSYHYSLDSTGSTSCRQTDFWMTTGITCASRGEILMVDGASI